MINVQPRESLQSSGGGIATSANLAYSLALGGLPQLPALLVALGPHHGYALRQRLALGVGQGLARLAQGRRP
ncbi:hypothetical protein QNO09_27585 [Streptomyces sp. 378]|uniref:hypothetical protein n=1 Tax=Streptomyces sp. 378 TaxID=3049412 RepID=UPI0024C411AE|nr:hypothetical protein [Streptomyces sp. 378]MDK1346998.1 hypothetical protein [Streptomyces sp. 378]